MVCLIVSLRLCSIFLSFFFFLFLTYSNFHCSIFKFDDASACSSMPWNPSSEFFISVIVLFSSGISVWFLFIFSISLLVFSICLHITFLSIFKTVVFNFFTLYFLQQVFLKEHLFIFIFNRQCFLAALFVLQLFCWKLDVWI